MNSELTELKLRWKEAKEATKPASTIAQIISKADEKRKNSLYTHYGNIAILAGVLLLVCVFFYYLFPFQQALSQSGVHIMVAGLAVRILIELWSVAKFRQIDLSDPTSKATKDSQDFYVFRKKVHGPVTITIVALYLAGFFMLTPEISDYVEVKWVIALDIISISAAVVLIRVISQGIQEELRELWEVVELRKKILHEHE
jgi:L-asparagine transporter-like permease